MGAEMKKLNIRKSARNKKRYWRKGTRLEHVEEFLHNERIDQQEGDLLRERIDSELFIIDRPPQSPSLRLTRKQIAAPNKRNLLQKANDEEKDIKPSKNTLKKMFPKKKKLAAATPRRESVLMRREGRIAYDLWAGDKGKDTSVEGALIEDYYLRSTKRKKPREPRTLKHIPSPLLSVEVPEPGASYNPTFPPIRSDRSDRLSGGGGAELLKDGGRHADAH